MPVRVAMLGVGHVHAPSYVHCVKRAAGADLIGHWDKDAALKEEFAKLGSQAWDDRSALVAACDVVIIAGENMDHAELVEAACTIGKSVLCEKPVAPTKEHRTRIEKAVHGSDAPFMTAFPCPFSPAFQSAVAKVEAGDIGKVLSVCATNHGKCPRGWFTDPSKSGGGAMIDHTVHVADLLRRVLHEEPSSVYAITGNNMYGQGWDDTAMVTVGFPSGAFATIDASWSRPKSFKTWGDVTMRIVGEKGVIELDLFLQGIDQFSDHTGGHAIIGYGSNLDQAMVEEFVAAHTEKRKPLTTLQDGLAASDVALAAYDSAQAGQPVQLRTVSPSSSR